MEHISNATRDTLRALIDSLRRKRERQYQNYNETHLQITMLQEQLENMEPAHGDQLEIDKDAKKGKK